MNFLQTLNGFINIKLNTQKSIRNVISFPVGANHCPLINPQSIDNIDKNNNNTELISNQDMIGYLRLRDL